MRDAIVAWLVVIAFLGGCVVFALPWRDQKRAASTAYARGYAAAVDSVKAAGPWFSSAWSSPNASMRTLVVRGAAYSVVVIGARADTLPEPLAIGWPR